MLIASTRDVSDPQHRTLPAAFQASVARVPERVALRKPKEAVRLTWADYSAAVERVAGSLAALGVGRGDRVVFFSRNRPELAIAEVATMHLGACGVALYTTALPTTIEHILRDSEPSLLLVESGLGARLTDVRHSVPHVFALDPGQAACPELASVASPGGFDFQAAWRGVRPEDLAALIYTSGTTGPPKAVEWTHLAATSCIGSFDATLGEEDGIHDISYGPFPALAERFGGHWHALVRGSTRTICDDPSQLSGVLLDARPTRLGGSTQVWQGLKRALEVTLSSEERAVLDASVERVRALTRGESPGSLEEAEEATLKALRARVGLDRTTRAGSTAAPCPLAVHEHYHALGVPFQEFFAMTETGVNSAQRPGLIDFGTLGAPAPGYELQIARDGEVLVRSSHAPRGYRGRPRESAETYGVDGWISTGDIGELDAEGRLRLIGRKKEMLIPEHGHNVAPVQIESALKDACPQIVHVCVLGDARPHLAALVAVDPSEPTGEDEVRAAVAAAIERVNAGFEPRERIEAHAIVADAWLPGAELTDTLKMRRLQIAERYATTIEGLYTPLDE
jgi:long-chain acyl-CoA synthetase